MPLTKRLVGVLYEFLIAVIIEGHSFSMFRSARSLFRLLKAFSASMNKMPGNSGVSNCFLRLCIACSIPHFLPRRSCCCLPKSFRSFSTQRSMVLPMIRLRTSSTPIGRTPGFLSRGIRRQALYGISASASFSISSVAILTAKRASVRQSDVDDWLKLDIQRRHSFASTPEGPWLPCVFHSGPTNGSCLCYDFIAMII